MDEPTLRDLFAMLAMNGVLSNPEAEGADCLSATSLAISCYKMADAMLEARKQ